MSMTTRAAVLWGVGEPWTIEDVELDEPRANDVLVRLHAAGMCHSDDHAKTGDMPMPLPVIGGHEGAGVVEAIGPDVRGLAVGDHVAVSFVPACGTCRWCSTGRQYLCDNGAKLFDMGMMSDGREAHHAVHDGERVPVGRYAQLGTFSERILVNESSLIKVDDDLPFEVVALVSCGVATGFGSATERAGTKPGDNVAVIGVGGIGINAVQGARIAGAQRVIAIDPVEFKREQAMALGATHAYASVEEAMAEVGALTGGVMCERVILSRRCGARRHDRPGPVAHGQGRHPRGHRRGARHRGRHQAEPDDALDDEQGDQGHHLRLDEPAGVHPAPAVDVPRGRAEARRAGDPPVHPRPGEPGLRRHARRQATSAASSPSTEGTRSRPADPAGTEPAR